MKVRQILMAVGLACVATAGARQPLTGCWFPNDITEWSAEKDPTYRFNRSVIPLAPRLREPATMTANSRQEYTGQICNATILYPHCGSSPSQGAANFAGYSPTYWQYMDKVVYWAGSSGEGIICPPPAYSIDAAHLNGVKILGNVFFPPTYYGGKAEWVTTMLTHDGGEFPYARKLFEIARDFGFDGWFINEETVGGNFDTWAEFIRCFQTIADSEGYGWMEIQWYDALRKPNVPILSVHKNVSQFIEYGAVKDWRSYASQINCSEDEVFSKIYCGVECVQSGLTGYNSALNTAFPKSGGHVASLDLFCPEEHAWKRVVSGILGSPDACGEKAYTAQRQVFANEATTWVNRKGDPSLTETAWRGISGCVAERSVITSLPFVSRMCNGLGKHRFSHGEILVDGDWWHPGLQHLLPTWRWWIENGASLTVSENWDDAWELGSCYTVSGTLTSGNHLMRLYKTMLPIDKAATFRVVYKSNGGRIIPVVSTESSVTDGQIALSDPKTTAENGWTIDEYDMSALIGKTVYMLSLNLQADADIDGFEASIGEIAVVPTGYVGTMPVVSTFANQSEPQVDGTDLCLTWDYAYSPDLDHFDIYVTNSAGRFLAGQTRGQGYYVPRIARDASDNDLKVELVAVPWYGPAQNVASLTVEYPALTVPDVAMKPLRSYAKVGDVVEVECIASPCPQNYSWITSAGLEIVEGDGPVGRFRAVEEGLQTVDVLVSNSVGSSGLSLNLIDVLSDESAATVGNVALGKKIVGYNGSANASEVPSNLLDGKVSDAQLSQKWCVANSAENWVEIDLGEEYTIYGFRIFDCKAGPENAENIDNYRIRLSDDGKQWRTVADETGRADDNVKEDFIAPERARYVRLEVWNDLPFTMRMWEFEVIALGAVEASVAEIAADGFSRLFTLDGRVVNPSEALAPGIYIMQNETQTKKIIVR